MARYPTFHQTEKGGGSKTPTVTGRKGNANRARAVPEMDVWRKHEAEAVYVANSEPAIWPWEGGRAGVAERDPISGVELGEGKTGSFKSVLLGADPIPIRFHLGA